MRYIPQPEALLTRAEKYIGREVRDTTGRQGEVTDAVVNPRKGTISLMVVSKTDGVFVTDNEHATIVKD